MVTYDPFQIQAIDYINQGNSVLVSAPTGAGKTVIAEHVIQDCLQRDAKVIYTAPIKALSNQKYRDFQQTFPGKVGILTGDVSLNAHAPALIMTTEIFRNKIIEEHSSLKHYSWIIFDEIHYLDDLERGSVWEESLIFLPDHMRVLGLSATIPNLRELAAWLKNIHRREIKIVKEDKRPVPLHFYFQCQGHLYDNLQDLRKKGFHDLAHNVYHGRRFPRTVPTKPNRTDTLIKHLAEKDYLPCIYFTFSRRRTEYLANELSVVDFLLPEEKNNIRELFAKLCRQFDLEHESGTQNLRPLIERGIAYHHAGMLPTLKEVVERLFTTRMIKVIFTTETFALGVNMPARTVVFDDLRKIYGRSFATLKTRDFYQMAGRAGRRSIDTEGHVFCRVNPHDVSPEDVREMIYGAPEKVYSRFNASYATILNLYQQFGEELYDIYPSSFHYFQERKWKRKQAVEQLRTKVKLLKEFGHIHKNRVTEKGQFAARVYGYELLLSELYVAGTMEELNPLELAVLSMAVVFEPRKGSRKPPLSRLARKLERLTAGTFDSIRRLERRWRVRPPSKNAFYHLSPVVEGWLRHRSFEDVLQETNADAGEIVRYFRMSIQILREISEAPISPACRKHIQETIHLINRDVIDAEKQLRH